MNLLPELKKLVIEKLQQRSEWYMARLVLVEAIGHRYFMHEMATETLCWIDGPFSDQQEAAKVALKWFQRHCGFDKPTDQEIQNFLREPWQLTSHPGHDSVMICAVRVDRWSTQHLIERFAMNLQRACL